MRLLVPSAAACLLALPLVQDPPVPPQDEEPAVDDPTTIFSVRETERERIERELEGAWILAHYQPPVGIVEQENVQGFAMFLDGYLSLTFAAMEPAQGTGFLDAPEFFIQGGAHRYQVSDFLKLQTASILGFGNFNEDGIIVFEESAFPREYSIDLQGDQLALSRVDGTTLTFTRLGETDFPDRALDLLERAKAGGTPYED